MYTGVTSELAVRIAKHKAGTYDGFSKFYNCNLLVYYEVHDTMESVITREKQIKGGSRKDKLALIEAINPAWLDLYETIL